MKIDGKAIAQEILDNLKIRVSKLTKRGIKPHLAILLVGNNPASTSYVKRKEIKAAEIGAKSTLINLKSTIQTAELIKIINKLNNDKAVHGIIVQRPLPSHIDNELINQAVDPNKDIDGFHKNTKFKMPLAQAVIHILKRIHESESKTRGFKSVNLRGWQTRGWQTNEFTNWLKGRNIVVIGKGQTGGGPTIALLKKMGIDPSIVDSKTEKPKEIIRKADLVISAIGKPNVFKSNDLKKGTIIIGVGMHKGDDGKMHGDYEEEEIKNLASFYTSIPGGVGPINVATLLSNLITAAQNQNIFPIDKK